MRQSEPTRHEHEKPPMTPEAKWEVLRDYVKLLMQAYLWTEDAKPYRVAMAVEGEMRRLDVEGMRTIVSAPPEFLETIE